MSESKVPQIRFKGFSGEWDNSRLENLTNINQGLQIAISDRFTQKIDGSYFYITNEFLKESSNIKYYIFNPPESVLCTKDDVLMTRTGNTGEVVTDIDGAFHNNFFKIKFDSKKLIKDYLVYFLKLPKTQELIMSLAGVSTIPDLNHKDFYSIIMAFPRNIDEQTKIGNYFQKLDKLIEQKEKKHQKLKQLKKAMLDKMFPKHGADTPEIRFKGFSGKWEEKRLIEFSDLLHGDGDWILSEDITNNGEYKIVQLGSIGLGKYIQKDLKTVSLKTFESLSGTPIKRGDLLINRMVDGNVNSCIFELEGSYITSVDVCWIRENKYIHNYFLMSLLTIAESQRKLLSLSSGSGRIRISKKNLFSKFYFLIPSLAEQTKIGNYFQKLDILIDLQLQELEKLKNIKKASLDKMFI